MFLKSIENFQEITIGQFVDSIIYKCIDSIISIYFQIKCCNNNCKNSEDTKN